jgi:hypothetical protein
MGRICLVFMVKKIIRDWFHVVTLLFCYFAEFSPHAGDCGTEYLLRGFDPTSMIQRHKNCFRNATMPSLTPQ